jgi:hypothetical protein
MSATTARQRVVALTHSAAAGGGEIALAELLAGLDPRSFDCVVVVHSDGPLVQWLRDAGIRTYILPADGTLLTLKRKDILATGALYCSTTSRHPPN